MPFLARSQSKPLNLDQAIAIAFANRPSVQSARLDVDRAKATRRSMAAAPATELRVGISSDTRVGSSDDDLAVAQPIDIFGRTAAARASGDALLRQSEAALRRAEVDLQSDVIRAYLEAAASAERVSIAKQLETTAGELLGAVRQLVDGGRLAGIQATRASIEFTRSQATTRQREADVAANARRLSGAVGVELSPAETVFPSIPVEVIDDRALQTQRADLMALAAEISLADADKKVARASRRPLLELQGRRSPWQQADQQYGVRIQLSFPLFDSGKSHAEESAGDLRSRAASKALADALRLARTELDADLIEVDAAAEQLKALKSVLSTSRELYQRTQTGLKEGANTLVDTLDALRAVREIEESIVDAKLALGRAQAKYVAVTGRLPEVRP